MSVAPPRGEGPDPDEAFRFFVDHLDQITTRLGQPVDPASTTRTMLVDAETEMAVEAQP